MVLVKYRSECMDHPRQATTLSCAYTQDLPLGCSGSALLAAPAPRHAHSKTSQTNTHWHQWQRSVWHYPQQLSLWLLGSSSQAPPSSRLCKAQLRSSLPLSSSKHPQMHLPFLPCPALQAIPTPHQLCIPLPPPARVALVLVGLLPASLPAPHAVAAGGLGCTAGGLLAPVPCMRADVGPQALVAAACAAQRVIPDVAASPG